MSKYEFTIVDFEIASASNPNSVARATVRCGPVRLKASLTLLGVLALDAVDDDALRVAIGMALRARALEEYRRLWAGVDANEQQWAEQRASDRAL